MNSVLIFLLFTLNASSAYAAEIDNDAPLIFGEDDRYIANSYLTRENEHLFNGIGIFTCEIKIPGQEKPKFSGASNVFLTGDKQHVILTAHAIRDEEAVLRHPIENCWVYFFNYLGKRIDRFKAMQIAAMTRDSRTLAPTKSQNDWAILKLEKPVEYLLSLKPVRANFEKDKKITKCGYPLDAPDDKRKRCLSGTMLDSGLTMVDQSEWSFGNAIDTAKGSSGSPIFAEGVFDEVIGMHIGSFCNDPNRTYHPFRCNAQAIFFNDEFFEAYNKLFGAN